MERYQRQKGIEPAQAVQGFGQVAESVNVNQPLVDLGSKMASEASLKYAQIQGLQDAESDIKRRGKPIELLPINLTKTDEAYRQSYNQEGMGILSQQASQTFQTFYQTAIKNPTASSLAEFEQYGKQYINEYAQKAPLQYRSDFKRLLEDSYLNQYLKLSSAVENQARKDRDDIRMASANTQIDLIKETNLSNNEEGALSILDQRLQDIENQREIYKATGGQEGLSESQAKAYEKQAKDAYNTSKYQAEWRRAEAEGNGDAWIANLQQNKPKDMSEREHQVVMNGVIAYRNAYQAGVSVQQNIDYIGYKTKLEKGTFTDSDLIEAQDKLSATQMAQLEYEIASRLNKKKADDSLFLEYKDKLNSELGLAPISGTEKMDKVFDKYLQVLSEDRKAKGLDPEISFAERAELAKNIPATIPSINKQINQGIRSQNPKIAYQMASLLDMLAKANPLSVDGVKDQVKSAGVALKSLADNGTDINTAHDIVQKMFAPLTSAESDAIENSFKNFLSEKKLNTDYDRRTTYALKELDLKPFFGGIQAPPGLTEEYFNTLKANLLLSRGDMEVAQTLTKEGMRRTWNVETINGREQVMKFGPKTLLGNDYDPEMINSLINKQIMALNQNPILGFSFAEAPFETSLLGNEKPMKTVMTYSDGTKRTGRLELESDEYTNAKNPNLFGSYSVKFYPDDGIIPRVLVNQNGEMFRFTIDPKDIQAYKEKKMSERLEREKQLRAEDLAQQKIDALVQEARERYPD